MPWRSSSRQRCIKRRRAINSQGCSTVAIASSVFERNSSFAQRHGQPLSVVMFDVDHFKQVNDTYGHAAGDAVLQRIGRVVMELVRNEDVVCRYGGEEFVCILRGLTLDQGQLFADRVRRTIEAQVIASGEHVLRVTVSLGVAALRGMNFSNPEEMINEADAYLYVAKEGGRNQVASALTATS